MVRWARHTIDQGRVPLDGWFPIFSTGTSLFHRYQTLPHIVTAYLSLLTGVTTAYYWTLYLLLALWPLAVYAGARLMDWDHWTAAFAAMLSPLLVSAPGYGYEPSSYAWRGYGVWAQLFGMWLLPLAWGASWRVVSRGRNHAGGAAVLALTIACHFLTAYLALLSIGIWVLARPREIARRLGRAAILSAAGVLAAAWVIVPVLSDSHWYPVSEYFTGTFFADSYGAPKVTGWLLHGSIYDEGRFPIVSILVGLGVVVCLVRSRRDQRSRALLGVWALSLLLFMGRPTFGPLINLLPMNSSLLLHRYIMGVHMSGILLAGVGGAWLGRVSVAAIRAGARRWAPRVPAAVVRFGPPALATVAGVLLLWPAWVSTATYDRGSADLIEAQSGYDAAQLDGVQALVDEARSLGPGRFYAGTHFGWGRAYRLGYVPMYAVLAGMDADTVGFFGRVPSIMSDVETRFDETRPDQFDLYAIRYLILPEDRKPAIPAHLVDSRSGHRLWTVETTGYMDVVDVVPPAIQADAARMDPSTRSYLASGLPAHHQTQPISFDGAEAADTTLLGAPANGPGSIILAASEPEDGTFEATVTLSRSAAVMLKSAYDTRWQATVDGSPAPVFMVAPAYAAVKVGAGTHRVAFTYRPFAGYPVLFLIGAVSLGLAAALPRGWRRMRRTRGAVA